MNRTKVTRWWLQLNAILGKALTISISFVTITSTWADQLEQHNKLVNQFVIQMHANPLIADCAAHGNFVVGTSIAFDRVEFPPDSFDNSHSSITPWNSSFDTDKQRIKVDTIVTVEGLGIPSSGPSVPVNLKFRCGYVGTQMLAFSWNDPVPLSKLRAMHVFGKKNKGKHRMNKKIDKKNDSISVGVPHNMQQKRLKKLRARR